jgi:hypothetical protein
VVHFFICPEEVTVTYLTLLIVTSGICLNWFVIHLTFIRSLFASKKCLNSHAKLIVRGVSVPILVKRYVICICTITCCSILYIFRRIKTDWIAYHLQILGSSTYVKSIHLFDRLNCEPSYSSLQFWDRPSHQPPIQVFHHFY